MKKTLCAGAFALATIGLLSTIPAVSAGEMAGGQAAHTMAASINVGRIHRVLNLTPAQERYWRPVEAALRQLARTVRNARNSDGFVRRVSRRVVSIVLTSAAVERLAVAARPLIKVLDDRQKQAAGQLAQEMGLGPVVMAALN